MNEPERKEHQDIILSERDRKKILKVHEDVRPGIAS